MAKGSLRDRGGGPVRRPAESRRREGGRFRGRFVRLVRCAAFGCLLAAPAPSAGAASSRNLLKRRLITSLMAATSLEPSTLRMMNLR